MRLRALTMFALCAFLAPLILTPAVVWADHGLGLRSEAMSPWLAALLWGALGLAVAMIVAIVVMVFTRAPAEDGKDGRPRS